MDPMPYGLALNLGPAVAPPLPAQAAPAGILIPGVSLDAFRVNRWETAAVGSLAIVLLALYTNALLDAS